MRSLASIWLALSAFPVWAQIFFVDKKADGEDPGVVDLRGAYALAVSPDGKHVYAPGSLDHGLVVFSVDAFSGALSFAESFVDGQGGITSLESCRAAAVSPDGKHVYTAALIDSAVTVFSRNAVTGGLTFVQAVFDQNEGVPNGLGGANAVLVSPDGAHVYVGSRSDDAVVAFARDSGSGALTLIDFYQNNAVPIVGLDAPESLAISPDGNHLYVSAETSQSLAAFERDAGTGELTFIDAYFDGVGLVDGLGCTNNLAISADGDHVYAVGQFGAPSAPFCTVGFDDWMGIFARNPATGELTFVDTVSPDDFGFPVNCGGVAGDNGVVVSPDGTKVFATVQWHAAVVELARNATSGLLTLTAFDCADILDPDAILDLLSVHRVITDPNGIRTLATSLSPGTVIVYETEAYRDFRQAVEVWPTAIDVRDLLTALAMALAPAS